MTQPFSFEFKFGHPQPRPVGEASALRLLVLGDFSGAPSEERPALADRPTHRVDVDNLEDIFQRLHPRVRVGDETVTLESTDHLHPDSLYERAAVFQTLRSARAQPPSQGADLLSGLLGAAPRNAPAASAPTGPATDLQSLLRGIVAPHVVKDTAAETRAHQSAVDSAIALQMREVLHAPGFQSIESAWRGVQWLIAGLDLDKNLQLHLFDVTRDELLADLGAARGQLTESGLFRAIAARNAGVPGSQGWGLLAGLMSFGADNTDLGLLAALGFTASQAGGAFVASADRSLTDANVASLATLQALRASALGPSIALAAPRILLRAPYGKAHERTERFAFEEFDGSPAHEGFLWGSASLAAALVIGQTFSADGWEMQPDTAHEIGDFPAVTTVLDGERELQACAERYLSQSAADLWIAAGLCPLLSDRQRNVVRLPRVQSIALPSRPLSGPWTRER